MAFCAVLYIYKRDDHMSLLDASETAHTFLEEAGLKPTLNRMLVIQAILDSETALTAREVFEAVAQEHDLNRVTVYRILDQLSEKDAVNRVNCGDRVQHFCIGRHHSHFRCTGCGKVRCIANDVLHFDEDRLNRSIATSISNISLQLEGLCEECGEDFQKTPEDKN